jgi:hypothetical protein
MYMYDCGHYVASMTLKFERISETKKKENKKLAFSRKQTNPNANSKLIGFQGSIYPLANSEFTIDVV